MRWAQAGADRIEPAPGTVAKCPSCGGEVIAKCGEIVTWHWAHKAKDCDPWSEPESEWHKNWKAKFPPRWQECTIGPHRADVITPIGVIEFQHSFLSTEKVKERESFYRALIWVVDASDWALQRVKRRHRCRQIGGWQRDFYVQRFQWSRPRKIWIGASRPVYLDTGPGSKHVFRLDGVQVVRGRTFAITQQVRKSDFLRMCYGLPFQPSRLLMNYSSFDYYADAMLRRAEIAAAAKRRDQTALSTLPLFAAAGEAP